MDWSNLGSEFVLALIPILVLALTTAISYGAAYLRERYAWAKKTQVLSEVESIARSTVLALQQTIVDGLKAKKADGKLTDEEKTELKKQALVTLESQLTAGQRKVLAAITSDLSVWLGNKIEEVLVSHKLEESIAGLARPTSQSPPI